MAIINKLKCCGRLLLGSTVVLLAYLAIVSFTDDRIINMADQNQSGAILTLARQARFINSRMLRITQNSNESKKLEVILEKKQSDSTVAVTTPPTTSTTTVQPQYVHRIENEYQHPLMTICEAYEGQRPIYKSETYGKFNRTETYENCRATCGRHNKTYATLVRGMCQCYNGDYNNKDIIDLEKCDATCSEDQPDCITRFKKHSITMRTGWQDGNKEWTTWMNLTDIGIRVRYRSCARSRDGLTTCTPEYQRESTSNSSISKQIRNQYIGCYTAKSVATAVEDTIFHQTFYQHKIYKDKIHNYITRDKLHNMCIRFCFLHRSSYALLSTEISPKANRTCHCTDNLLQSQPTDSCTGLGYAVYWLPETPVVTLKFTGETEKKGKVLVLGRYRSGSSMTQSFFSRYPESFTVFEPCKMMSYNFGDPTDQALLTALEAFYSCNVYKLPPLFFATQFVTWTTNMLQQRGADNNYMSDVLRCFQTDPKVDCAPYWLEACQRSQFLNVKVIRLFEVTAIEEFTKRNRDVHVLHLVRDPRALLSAQRLYGTRDPPEKVCNQMVAAGRMVRNMKSKGYKNIHEVFYEDLAVNASRSGARIYREMGFRMPPEVEAFLSREDVQNLEALPKSVSEVVVLDDPKFHIYRFLERYTLEDILRIDGNCTNVYKMWPGHYNDFETVIKKHGKEIEKFISVKKPYLASYIHKMRAPKL